MSGQGCCGLRCVATNELMLNGKLISANAARAAGDVRVRWIEDKAGVLDWIEFLDHFAQRQRCIGNRPDGFSAYVPACKRCRDADGRNSRGRRDPVFQV